MQKLRLLSNRKISDLFAENHLLAPQRQLIFLGISVAGFLILCSISQFLFPTEYSIFKHSVSSQGHPELNPRGFLVFNCGIILLGIIEAPHVIYFWKFFRRFSPWVALMGMITNVIALVGIILVGIFPLNMVQIHNIGALIGFFGTLFSIDIYLLLLILNNSRIFRRLKSNYFFFIGAFGTNSIFVIMILSYLVENQAPIQLNFSNPIWNFPWWEWVFLYCAVGWLFLISYCIYASRVNIRKEER